MTPLHSVYKRASVVKQSFARKQHCPVRRHMNRRIWFIRFGFHCSVSFIYRLLIPKTTNLNFHVDLLLFQSVEIGKLIFFLLHPNGMAWWFRQMKNKNVWGHTPTVVMHMCPDDLKIECGLKMKIAEPPTQEPLPVRINDVHILRDRSKRYNCKLWCFCFARKHPIGNRFLMSLWVCLVCF